MRTSEFMRRPATAKRLSASAEAWEKRFPSYSALRRTPQKRIYLERKKTKWDKTSWKREGEMEEGRRDGEKRMNGSSDEIIITHIRVSKQPFIHECTHDGTHILTGTTAPIKLNMETSKRSHNRNYVYKRT